MPHQPQKPAESRAIQQFLWELFTPIAPSELAMNLQRAGINADGLRPYRRFLSTLFTLATDTYLGGNGGIRYSAADMKAHLSWCLAESQAQTLGDGFRYVENTELMDYLREYLRLELYEAVEVPTATQLDCLLNPEGITSRSELKSLIELYEIFQLTLTRGRRLNRPRIAS